MTTGKTIALTRCTFVDKVMSLLFKVLSRLVITFLPRSKHLLISWLQSPPTVILEPKILKYTNSSWSSIWKKQTLPSQKMAKRPTEKILLISHTYGQKPHEKMLNITNYSVQFSSVAQSCLTLCDPRNRSTPGLPVHHCFHCFPIYLPWNDETRCHDLSFLDVEL